MSFKAIFLPLFSFNCFETGKSKDTDIWSLADSEEFQNTIKVCVDWKKYGTEWILNKCLLRTF